MRYSPNILIACLIVACFGAGACSDSQDIAGRCLGDIDGTTNANTHLLANTKIAEEAQAWILKLGKSTAVVKTWGNSEHELARVEWEGGYGYAEAKSDRDERITLKFPNLIKGNTLTMICVPTEQHSSSG